MSKERNTSSRTVRPVGTVVAVAIVLVIAVIAMRRDSSETSAENDSTSPETSTGVSSPGATIDAIITAERTGDVDAFRAQLAGPAREEFNRRLQNSSRSQVAGELRTRLVGLKGHVFHQVTTGGDQASMIVELVFADRNQREQFELRRADGNWKIVRRHSLDEVAPPIRYGTPVTPE